MEEILAVVIFGIGASLGMKAVNAVAGGISPVVRTAVKGGMAATDTARSAVSRAGQAMADIRDEARQEMQAGAAKREPQPSSKAKKRSTPQQIEIAQE